MHSIQVVEFPHDYIYAIGRALPKGNWTKVENVGQVVTIFLGVILKYGDELDCSTYGTKHIFSSS